MAKEYGGSPKLHKVDNRRRRLTYILVVSGLCIFFYVLGAWQASTRPPPSRSDVFSKVGCEEKTNSGTSSSAPGTSSSSSAVDSLDFESHHQLIVNTSKESEIFPPCDMSYAEYTPCQDAQRGRKFDRAMLKYRERHCPAKEELLRCLIPAPPNYKTPFKWPQSRDYARYANIPHKELSIEKAVQNWIQVEGDKFKFPGGGTMFPRGADAYIDDISALIPLTDGSIRTAVDTGCGVRNFVLHKSATLSVTLPTCFAKQCLKNIFISFRLIYFQVASWGAYLLKRNIIGMSFAPRDTHEAQVWFALERGVPAMIGIMGSQRLPYPARAFDMAHCSRCLIPWKEFGEMFT